MHENEKKSTGIPNILIKCIKMFAEYQSSVLANIFKKCMRKGILPFSAPFKIWPSVTLPKPVWISVNLPKITKT